ncbi:MAG: hypothetical protein HC803_09430, partial [Saprospiraceae bacterium]|nr:hypothetical protein [Saprospiraceae bacterium]
MSDVIVINVLRFLGLFLVQVLILINVEINTSYVNLYIYPLFLLLLPVSIQRNLLLIIAFFMGIAIDMFYDTSGIHAAACVFVAYIRSGVLIVIEPRGGYEGNQAPTKRQFGAGWFFNTLVYYYSFTYFSLLLETFSFAG